MQQTLPLMVAHGPPPWVSVIRGQSIGRPRELALTIGDGVDNTVVVDVSGV